ncbi:MAG: YraN family protein [Pseudomonadota bacterium]
MCRRASSRPQRVSDPESPAPHLDAGRAAEDIARNHLCAAGLRLQESNYACREGEIDLVMWDSEVLVFVEVRFRQRRDFGGATATVDGAKQRRLARAATRFLTERHVDEDVACRFDVIGIGPERHQIAWIKGAFDAPSEYL